MPFFFPVRHQHCYVSILKARKRRSAGDAFSLRDAFPLAITFKACHPEQANATAGNMRASKDPENLSVRDAASRSSYENASENC
jgi:hypothetical protein